MEIPVRMIKENKLIVEKEEPLYVRPTTEQLLRTTLVEEEVPRRIVVEEEKQPLIRVYEPRTTTLTTVPVEKKTVEKVVLEEPELLLPTTTVLPEVQLTRPILNEEIKTIENLKHWFARVPLNEEEMFLFNCPELVLPVKTEEELLQPLPTFNRCCRLMMVKIDPIRRVLVVYIPTRRFITRLYKEKEITLQMLLNLNIYNDKNIITLLEQECKKVLIRLPHFINLQQTKVFFHVEKKHLLIRAPFTTVPVKTHECQYIDNTTVINTTTPLCLEQPRPVTLLMKEEEIELEKKICCRYPQLFEEEPEKEFFFNKPLLQQQLMQFEEIEVENKEFQIREPTLYKLIKHMRLQLPTFIVPRVVRHLETGVRKIYLDVTCNAFRPEEMKVVLKKLERCLVIKAERTPQLEQQLVYNNTINCFYPKTFCHELVLPELFNLEKINWYKINEKVVRIEMPIVKVPVTNVVERTVVYPKY